MNIKSVCFAAIATCLGAFAPQQVQAGSLTGIALECVGSATGFVEFR
ncbi:MAG: hypothetical protein QM741_09350 [Rudaea sp.]